MKIAEALKDCVDRFAREELPNLPLYKLADEGKLTPAQLAYYLKNLGWIMNQNFAAIEIAAQESLSRGMPRAYAYYTKKLQEEVGHSEWAQEDADRIEEDFAVKEDSEFPSLAARNLVRVQYQQIAQKPAYYVTYVFFTEYFTVHAGPQWMNLLRERCGFDTRHFEVVDRHVELDIQHTAENMEDVDLLAEEANASKEEMIAALRATMDAYVAIYSDVRTSKDQYVEAPSASV